MLAISTCCLDLDPRAERPDLDRLLAFDVPGHELAGPLSGAALRETAAAIRQCGRVLTDLRAPCPLTSSQVEHGVARALPSLSDPDATHRAAAVADVHHSLDWAARLEIPVVVLAGTPSGSELPAAAAAMVDTPAWAGPPGQALRRDFLSARAPRAAARMDALCFALDELLGHAVELEVEVALENRAQPGELPDRSELAQILERFAGAPLVTWYHAAAAWYEERLTLDTAAEWRATLGNTLGGVRLDDRTALVEVLPPGEGALDYAALGQGLPGELPAVLVGSPDWQPERMVAALEHLQVSRVGGAPPPPVEPFPIIGGS